MRGASGPDAILASAWTALGLALIYMGMIPLNESQRTYFANLTIFDHATTAILAAINTRVRYAPP